MSEEIGKKFEDVENEFDRLKEKYLQNEISEKEFKAELKKLRIRDKQGKCWTIGARTGKWYYFDGEEWVEADPPSVQQGKAICIYCGYENDLENEVCENCGGELDEEKSAFDEVDFRQKAPDDETAEQTGFSDDFDIGRVDDIPDTADEPAGEEKNAEDGSVAVAVIKAIHPVSSLFFWGIIGLIIGIVMGVFVGTTDFFSGVVGFLPAFLQTLGGQLVRGVLYGLIGGAIGFIVAALFGLLLALLVNLVLYFLGGFRVNTFHP